MTATEKAKVNKAAAAAEFKSIRNSLFYTQDNTGAWRCGKCGELPAGGFLGGDFWVLGSMAIGEEGSPDYLCRLQQHPCWAVAADVIFQKYSK